MKRLLPALVLSLLLPASAGAENGAARRLSILFTNDVHGYVEPCG